jgi:Na+/melibiose symporter-like transporter
MAPLCFKARERVESRQKQEDIGIADMFRFLAHNKYMFIYFAAFILARIFDIATPLNLYVARYNLGKEELMGLFIMVSSAPGLVVAALIPMLCKKFDKFILFWWSTIAAIVLGVLAFFIGSRSLPVVLVIQALRGIPGSLLVFLMFLFTPDCVEYGAYKSGVKASGIAFSLQTFSVKLQAALAASAASLGLFFIKFVEGEGAVQARGFPEKLWFLFTIVPSFGYLISLPLLSRYKLRDKTVQVMAEYNTGTLSREEAEAKLLAFGVK